MRTPGSAGAFRRGLNRAIFAFRRCVKRHALPGSVLVNDAVLGSLPGQDRLWGAVAVKAFGMDSSGWPVPPGSDSSSHYARHGLSRRAFIGGAAVAATGASLGSGLLWPAAASAAAHSIPLPRPTPATTIVNKVAFHFVSFGPGVDPSSITDFKGFVGVADVRGTGTARNPDGSVEKLLFDTDMRFMKGTYVGLDGKVHEATFGFV